MNKKLTLHAALAVMCSVAFSVCVGSCDKNDIDNHEAENSFSLTVDTNGVKFTLVPLIDWNATLADVDEYMAKNFPDCKIDNDGKLRYNSNDKRWTRFYSSENLSVDFYFNEASGRDLAMMDFFSYVPGDINSIRDELVRSGFKYKGLLYYDYIPDYLNSFYLSADEKLEVQLYWENNNNKGWGICFQPTDLSDYNHLIDETVLSINTYTGKDSCTLIPLLDWDASVDGVKDYMAENYPDWTVSGDGELMLDTARTYDNWYMCYYKDSLVVVFAFNDMYGTEYTTMKYVNWYSTDLVSDCWELTRNGYIYKGETVKTDTDLNDAYCFVSPDYKNMIAIASWKNDGGCRTMEIRKYDEERLKRVIGD